MYIDDKNYTLDSEVYELFQENWKNNINEFKNQNTGIIVNNVEKLTEDDIIKFINNTVGKLLNRKDILIDKKFIYEHYDGLAVNPITDDFKQNFTAQCNLRPDLSYINIVNRGE